MLTLLLVVLSQSPSVEQLTLTEAKIEDLRLARPPSRVAGKVMIGLGSIGLASGVIATGFTIDDFRRSDGYGALFLNWPAGVVSVLMAVAGTAFCIIGARSLFLESERAGAMEARRVKLRARLLHPA